MAARVSTIGSGATYAQSRWPNFSNRFTEFDGYLFAVMESSSGAHLAYSSDGLSWSLMTVPDADAPTGLKQWTDQEGTPRELVLASGHVSGSNAAMFSFTTIPPTTWTQEGRGTDSGQPRDTGFVDVSPDAGFLFLQNHAVRVMGTDYRHLFWGERFPSEAASYSTLTGHEVSPTDASHYDMPCVFSLSSAYSHFLYQRQADAALYHRRFTVSDSTLSSPTLLTTGVAACSQVVTTGTRGHFLFINDLGVTHYVIQDSGAWSSGYVYQTFSATSQPLLAVDPATGDLHAVWKLGATVNRSTLAAADAAAGTFDWSAPIAIAELAGVELVGSQVRANSGTKVLALSVYNPSTAAWEYWEEPLSAPSTTPTGSTVGGFAVSALAAGNNLSAPTGLTAVAVSVSQIDVSWNPVSEAMGYDIERDGVKIVDGHPTTSYSDMGLSPNTQYAYRVRAVKL